MDFTVVFSYFAETLSARYADILLPQIATAFEGRACQCGHMSSDLFYSGCGLGNYFIYRQKCLDPPEEIKTNEWIWLQIAKRLGIAELAYPRLVNVPDDRWNEAIEDLHREAYEDWALRKDIAPLNPPAGRNSKRNLSSAGKLKTLIMPLKKSKL